MDKKILWLSDHKYYDGCSLDILHERGIEVVTDDNPDYILSHIEELEQFSHIVCRMFLAVGHKLDMKRCEYGMKTGFILFHDIVDKIKETKLILRVASSIEIYQDEYDFCKEKGITVVNDSNSTYDTIYQLITGKRFYEDDSTQSDVDSTVSDESSTLKDTITIKREKNSMFVYICGTEPIYNVGDVFAEYKCTPDYEGETTYGEIVEIKFDDYAEDWLYVFDNGTEVSEQYIISGDLYILKR